MAYPDQGRPGYTEQQEQDILEQHADLLASLDENPRFVHCPRCPEDGHDNHSRCVSAPQ